jgi:hypothetical protein
LTTDAFRLVMGVTFIVVALAGCAGGGGDPASPAPVFAQAIEEARAGGASQAQIDLLERLAEKGSVELDDVREALAGTYECLDAAGISHSEEVVVDDAGVEIVRIDMRQPITRDVDAGIAVADACIEQHSMYVQDLYVQQPSVVEIHDKHYATVVTPAFLECYEKFGLTPEEDRTDQERWSDAYDVIFASPGVRPGDPTLEGCLYEAMFLAP